MGHQSRGEFNSARSAFGECGAQMLVAESVNSRVADHVGGMVCALAPGPFATVGSLYSGCFDELGRGLCRVLGPLSCVFVAELDDGKRKVLEDSLSPLYAFSDVSEVKGKRLPVDVLCITPPCVDVTRNRRAFNRLGGVPLDLVARGAAAVSEQLAAITEAVHSSSPSVIVIEQSPGLASHHPAAYVAFNAGIQRLPYVYYHGSVEASSVSQSSAPTVGARMYCQSSCSCSKRSTGNQKNHSHPKRYPENKRYRDRMAIAQSDRNMFSPSPLT